MRGLILGIILLPAVIVTLLSIRPGGLRSQLRNAARRLRLVLVLAGIYLIGSAVVRLGWPGSSNGDVAQVALAVALALVFVIFGQDNPPFQRPVRLGRPPQPQPPGRRD